MELKLKYGIDNIVFGMTEFDIVKILGNPDKISKDDNEDVFYQYNESKIRVTFLSDEQGKLGNISCANSKLLFKGKKIIGSSVAEVKSLFNEIEDWEIDRYETFDSYYNEEVNLTLNVEYDEITYIDIFVPFNDSDEYEWKK